MRLAAAALAAALPACAGDVLWHAQVDNDVPFGTDRWYTSGVRIHRSGPGPAPTLLAGWLPAPDAHRLDIGIVQEVHTPETKRGAAGDGDGPYAGRLLLSVASQWQGPGRLDTIGLDAGVTGPASLARQSQALVHRLVPGPETDWSNQLSNRLDLQAVVAFSRQVAAGALPGALVLHGGAVAGTMTAFGHAGIEWRSAAGGPHDALLRFAATPPVASGPVRGPNAFAGASMRGVARNRLLARNEGDGRESVKPERRVHRLVAGLSWSFERAHVTFSLARDSREFEGQRAPHRFGSLAFSLPLP